jgi:hypothetical protein
MFLGHNTMSTIKVILFTSFIITKSHFQLCLQSIPEPSATLLATSQRPLSGANQYTKAPPSTSPDWLATLSSHLLQLQNSHTFSFLHYLTLKIKALQSSKMGGTSYPIAQQHIT